MKYLAIVVLSTAVAIGVGMHVGGAQYRDTDRSCVAALDYYYTHTDALGVAQYPADAQFGLDFCLRVVRPYR